MAQQSYQNGNGSSFPWSVKAQWYIAAMAYDLTKTEHRVLGIVVWKFANKDGEFWPKLATLGSLIGLSEKQVSKALLGLAQKGILDRIDDRRHEHKGSIYGLSVRLLEGFDADSVPPHRRTDDGQFPHTDELEAVSSSIQTNSVPPHRRTDDGQFPHTDELEAVSSSIQTNSVPPHRRTESQLVPPHRRTDDGQFPHTDEPVPPHRRTGVADSGESVPPHRRTEFPHTDELSSPIQATPMNHVQNHVPEQENEQEKRISLSNHDRESQKNLIPNDRADSAESEERDSFFSVDSDFPSLPPGFIRDFDDEDDMVSTTNLDWDSWPKSYNRELTQFCLDRYRRFIDWKTDGGAHKSYQQNWGHLWTDLQTWLEKEREEQEELERRPNICRICKEPEDLENENRWIRQSDGLCNWCYQTRIANKKDSNEPCAECGKLDMPLTTAPPPFIGKWCGECWDKFTVKENERRKAASQNPIPQPDS